MAFFLYKKQQDASKEEPAHKINRNLFDKIREFISVREVAPNALQLLTNETLTEIKARFRQTRSRDYTILPVRDWGQGLLLYYPHKSQESNA